MVDVFEEVEDEMRAHKWRTLARRYLPWVGGAAAALVIGVGGTYGWSAWQESRAGKASVAYDRGLKALQTGDRAGADAAFAEAGKLGTRGYRTLALMQQGHILVGQDKSDEAVKLFDEAAKVAPSPILGDNASLKAAFALMDKASYEEMEKRLTPLTEDGRPYRATAKEALAMAKIQAGKVKEARGDFVVLSLLSDAPEGVRARAQAAIQMIDSGTAAKLPALAKAAAELPKPQAAPAGQNPFAPQTGAPVPQAGAGKQ
ncbi:tetratricopeptide repeat protein [Caulobacter sp. 17J65-9]|uniref:tetratricopeptide repeat protein n=1 Tax=Caulobacter sp. 17J65-9 TaxID=2709382 RepID=UPI0013CCE43F|nr:tetratricopeptide repeat protein [Caulobacter sp. 17J65-9]